MRGLLGNTPEGQTVRVVGKCGGARIQETPTVKVEDKLRAHANVCNGAGPGPRRADKSRPMLLISSRKGRKNKIREVVVAVFSSCVVCVFPHELRCLLNVGTGA